METLFKLLSVCSALCLVSCIDDEEFINGEEGLEEIEDTLPMDRAIITTPGPNNVICGKSTTRPINDPEVRALTVLPGESFQFTSTKKTRRCVATFAAGEGCPEIRVTCPYFYVPNADPDQCRRGDFFRVKDFEAEQPQVYCNEDKPTPQFPAVSSKAGGRLKLWYEQSPPTQATKNKGVYCVVSCAI